MPVTVQKSTKVGVLRPLVEVCVDVCAAEKASIGAPHSSRKSINEVIEQLLSDAQDLNCRQRHAQIAVERVRRDFVR